MLRRLKRSWQWLSESVAESLVEGLLNALFD